MSAWSTRYAVVVLFATILLPASGQDKQGTKVLLYKDRVAAQFDTVKCVKNVIKANPLLFFRGEIPVYYERALTHRLSIEVGVGITLRNFLNLSVLGDDADDFGAGTEIIPRASFRLGARFYFEDDIEPQGLYLQPELAYLSYSKFIREKGPDGLFTDRKNRDDRVYNDLRLYLGYQMLASTSNWLFDVYGGIGVRDRSMRIVEEEIALPSELRTYYIKEVNDLVPVLFLGVKVGVGF
jgi:hypothetical protein